MKTALIVQPHSDDVLFSCAHILFNNSPIKYDKIRILTVENDEKRFKEDLRLKEFFDVEIDVLPFVFKDETYYSYFQENKKMDNIEVINHLSKVVGDEKLEVYINNLTNYVEKANKTFKSLDIYSPLGIGHPTHLLVYQILSEVAKFYYREWPHSYKRRNKEQLLNQSKIHKLVYKFDDLDFHQTKFDIAKAIYKSQSSLLFFEGGHIKNQYPEEIYI